MMEAVERRPRTPTWLTRALVALVAVFLVACGGGKDGTDRSGGTTVGMHDDAFNPTQIAYDGGSLRLVNDGAALHNFSVRGHRDIDVDVAAGASKTIGPLSLQPGTYKVICKYHVAVGMTATLTVT